MRTAIVGCGTIAEVHAKSLEQVKGCKIIAFSDIKKDRAEYYADRFWGKAYKDFTTMLNEEEPDVLHICTPHYLHVPMAITALKSGAHVFVEKPAVISREQLKELECAVAKANTRLGICFQNRYNKCIQKARALIESGKAGHIIGARGVVTWSRDIDYYQKSDWRGSWDKEGGGVLINQSIHTLDLLQYLLKKPLFVEATISNHHLKNFIEVEDTVEAYIQFEKSIACFYATTAYCTNATPLIELECENMRIRLEDPNITIYHKDGRIERPDLGKGSSLGMNYYGSGHVNCIYDFYNCLRDDRHFPQELSDMRESIRWF